MVDVLYEMKKFLEEDDDPEGISSTCNYESNFIVNGKIELNRTHARELRNIYTSKFCYNQVSSYHANFNINMLFKCN